MGRTFLSATLSPASERPGYEPDFEKTEILMLKSIEAVIFHDGSVKLKEKIHLDKSLRAIVTILDEEMDFPEIDEITLLSEKALAEDWNREEEDKAWSHLQPVQ